MAKHQGYDATLEISTDGSTYYDINGLVDVTFNGNVGEMDSTTHDDSTFRTYLVNRMDGTLDGSVKWDESDTGQNMLETSWIGLGTRYYRYRMQTGSGYREYKGTGFVTSLSPSGPNDDVAEASFSIRLSGTITNSPNQT